MNRNGRRAPKSGAGSRLTPKQICHKLKSARPTDAMEAVLARNAEGKPEFSMQHGTTDWSWLCDVYHEGFDFHAPNGPTYYRCTESHYYSVFFHPHEGHPVLLISHLSALDSEQRQLHEEQTEISREERGGQEHRNVERSDCPWLCLAYSVSPAVGADIKSDEQAQEIVEKIRLLLKQGYEFALAHELPLDKSLGFFLDERPTGRTYMLTVDPEEREACLDYAPADFGDRLRSSPNFHHIH